MRKFKMGKLKSFATFALFGVSEILAWSFFACLWIFIFKVVCGLAIEMFPVAFIVGVAGYVIRKLHSWEAKHYNVKYEE